MRTNSGEHHLNCSKQQIHGTSWYELVKPEYLNEAQLKHKRITSNEQERSTIALLHLMNFDHSNSIWIHSVMQVKEAADSTTQPVIVCTNQVMSEREAHVMRANSWLYQFYSLHSKMHCNFASGSPADMDRQVGTPDSDCSNFDNERGDVKSKGTSAKLERPQTAINTSFNNDSLSTGKKSPLPSSTISATTARTKQLASPIKQSATTPSTCIYPNSYQQVDSTTALKHNKLAPQSPPSSASTISSSPILNLPSYTQQSNATGSCGYARALTSSNRTSATNEFKQGARNEPHYHNYAGSLGGSSSASSTSSVSSTSSLQSSDNSSASNVAQSMAAAAAAAAAAGNGSVAAAGLYAGGFDTTTIDPLQHMHHHAHHPGHPATMYSSTSNHHAGHQHHHHTAAAVNYASHMMAAQRVAHQSHHHHYHPYSHPQHHPSMHRTSHVAPHHHNHHTNPHAARAAAAAAALYAPAHHQVASLNGAFGHHQHAHSHHAAAYHSAAAVAAANVGQHPSHSLQASANTIPNPYHSSDAAAAAAAAAAHQGVSFHYNKIAAAVNASA